MHLLSYASLVLTASAIYIPNQPRADSCLDPFDGDDVASAGIGAEFESGQFRLKNPDCSLVDSNESKGKIIAGRTGTNFMLTADTNEAGVLNTEYILNGQNIKVGSGDAAKAGDAAAKDLMDWEPWKADPPINVDVADSKCNPWTIGGPKKTVDAANVEWLPQITVPMPLEGLYDIMKIHENIEKGGDEKSILEGFTNGFDYFTLVTKDYFRSNPNGMEGAKVTNDVLSFCSLVLSYAKAAIEPLSRDASPKLRTPFMPRTEFNTIYDQVKSKISGDLFDLFNALACYKNVETPAKNGEFNVVLDTEFCKGTTAKPIPGKKFSGLKYSNDDGSVEIKSWIEGIQARSPSPDLLTEFDKTIDGSIGGFGTTTEKMYKSDRSVPIFEFRGLRLTKTSEFESFMGDVDSVVQKIHEKYPAAPQEKRRRAVSGCRTSSAATTTATTTTQATPKPTQGCQSPDHDGLVSFTLDDGNTALADFSTQCQGVELKPGGPIGCIMYYEPCDQANTEKTLDIVMTVEQTEWNSGVTQTWPNTEEMTKAVVGIMNSCDTTTTEKKWGGFKSVGVDAGMRMYNVSANVKGLFPTPKGFHVVEFKDTSKNCNA